MFRRSWSLFLAVPIAACAADQPADRGAEMAEEGLIGRVDIVEPVDGAVVGPEVRVVLSAVGVEVEPSGPRVAGSGHHHIFIDADVTPSSDPIPAGQPGIVHLGDGSGEYTVTGLAAGEHRLIAVLAYGDHVPMERIATDTVRLVVRAP